MDYAKYLQKLMDDSQLTIDELAQILDLTVPAIKKILAGNVKNPSMQTIERLAEFNHVSPIEIVQRIFCVLPTEEDDLSEKAIKQINTSQRYLCYLYLNGYNVDFGAKFKSIDGTEVFFPGIATKKREPNNRILVDSITTRFLVDRKKDQIIYNTDLATLLAPLMFINDINEFKRVDIVVGDEIYELTYMIPLIEKLKLPFKFKLNIVVFDYISETIIQTIPLT